MSLTLGRAPFGLNSAGCFNFDRQGPDRILYWEDFPKRVTAKFAGVTIADSRRVKALFETGRMMTFYFPREDISMEKLRTSDRRTHCPLKGDASYWTIRAGGRDAENAAWSYQEPIKTARFLAGYVAFEYETMDAWYQEQERIYAHPRDPYHRFDIHETDRKVVVSLDQTCVAECAAPLALFETGLPPRFYLPSAAVRTELLSLSETVSHCPYKGDGQHWHLEIGEKRVEDAAWSLPRPLGEAERIRDWFSFYPSKLRVEVDGETLEH